MTRPATLPAVAPRLGRLMRLGLFLSLALLALASPAAPQRAAAGTSGPELPTVDDVPAAFNALSEWGEWLGWFPGDGSPSLAGPVGVLDQDFGDLDSYQGIQRAATGPYLFLVRDGTANSEIPDVYSFGGGDAAAVMTLRIASWDGRGERLRSNRLEKEHESPQVAAGDGDEIIKNKLIDLYTCTGGIQLAGDYLAVPVSDPKDNFIEGSDGVPYSKITFYNVSYPPSPKLLATQILPQIKETSGSENEDVEIEWVGFTKLPEPDGRYLVVAELKAPDAFVPPFLRFWKSVDGTLATLEWYDDFEFGDLVAGPGVTELEKEYSSLQLVPQTDGTLYAIGSSNTSLSTFVVPLTNQTTLFRIDGIGGAPNGDQPIGITPVNAHVSMTQVTDPVAKQLKSNADTNMPILDMVPTLGLDSGPRNGDFDAGPGVWISPSGELFLYANEQYNHGLLLPEAESEFEVGPSDVYGWVTDGIGLLDIAAILTKFTYSSRFSEFSPRDVNLAGTCVQPNPAPEIGGPYTIPEGGFLQFDAFIPSVTEPWAAFYDDDDYTGERQMFDWADRHKNTFDDFWDLDGRWTFFVTDGFDNDMGSVRWCAPPGWTLQLFEDAYLTGLVHTLPGTGTVQGLPSIVENISSAQWVPPPGCTNFDGAYAWDTTGQGFSPGASFKTWPPSNFGIDDQHGPYDVSVQYTTPCGTTPAVDSATVHVTNVDPKVGQIELYNELGLQLGFEVPAVQYGTTMALVSSMTDPGSMDQHEVTIDWGDGSFETFDPDPGGASPSSTHVFSRQHVYSTPGTYTISVTARESHMPANLGTKQREIVVADGLVVQWQDDFDGSGSTPWVLDSPWAIAGDSCNAIGTGNTLTFNLYQPGWAWCILPAGPSTWFAQADVGTDGIWIPPVEYYPDPVKLTFEASWTHLDSDKAYGVRVSDTAAELPPLEWWATTNNEVSAPIEIVFPETWRGERFQVGVMAISNSPNTQFGFFAVDDFVFEASVLPPFECPGNLVLDPSFEAGLNNPFWETSSDQLAPVPTESIDALTGMASLAVGGEGPDVVTASQTVKIPEGADAKLHFKFQVLQGCGACFEGPVGRDELVVLVDDQEVWRWDPRGTMSTFLEASVDLAEYADGNNHDVTFRLASNSGGKVLAILVDDVCVHVPQGCAISGFELVQDERGLSPVDGSDPTVGFAASCELQIEEGCENATVQVDYSINGQFVATSRNAAIDFYEQVTIAPGTYTLSAVATMLSTGETANASIPLVADGAPSPAEVAHYDCSGVFYGVLLRARKDLQDGEDLSTAKLDKLGPICTDGALIAEARALLGALKVIHDTAQVDATAVLTSCETQLQGSGLSLDPEASADLAGLTTAYDAHVMAVVNTLGNWIGSGSALEGCAQFVGGP